jgi:hypothetical protein
MAMRPSKNIRDFIGRLIKVNSIILDAYKSYTMTSPEPIPDANGNVSLVAMRAHKEALIENMGEFYLLNQFRAALPVDLRRVINLQPMPTLDLDTAVRLATIELRSKDEAKSTSRIQAVQQEEEEEGVEAITLNRHKKFTPSNQQNRGQQNRQNYCQPNNYRSNNQQQWRSKPGNNSNKNKTTCSFCRIQGHRQEECRKQCCLDMSGTPFWPKINTTENSAPIQALQAQDFQF